MRERCTEEIKKATRFFSDQKGTELNFEEGGGETRGRVEIGR